MGDWPISFGKNLFSRPNLLWSRAVMLLIVVEDDCCFLCVHKRLLTRCKICFTLGLFANYFSLKSLRPSPKSQFVDYKFIVWFKVAEHNFGSLWVYVICQIMAREGLQLTSWNLASKKYTDEKFWLKGKICHFLSFHGNMDDWIQH